MQPVLIFLWRVSGRIVPSFSSSSNYYIFISPSFPNNNSLEGSRRILRAKKGIRNSFLLSRSNFFLPSVGYFYPREEGGTCKVDVSRNKIKLKIASIVAVSFVILRHFRAPTRETTLLERRRLVVDWWCGGGNRSPLARKRMRPKKNRYNRLYTILSS